MKISIENPIYRNGSVRLIHTFNTLQIISQYKSIGVDVGRFFEGLNSIELFECNKTGYRFYHPFSSIGDADFYKDLSLNRANYYSTRWEHIKALPILNSKQKVLEIGCGFGIFLNLLKNNLIEAEGIELNPEAIVKCKVNGYKVYDLLINDFAKKNQEKYDVVCSFQVLEHITNVHDFIKNALITLKPNGKLIIGVPNNNPYLFIKDKYHTLNLPPHHAGLWNKKSLQSLEHIFQIKLVSLEYEPLEKTYNQFLNAYIRYSNPFYSLLLKAINKASPIFFKKILCKRINGRNILAVFKKIT